MPGKIQLRIDPKVCSGCLSCMTTCSFVNESYVSLAAARVQVVLRPFAATNVIEVCRQCGKAPCAVACKLGAIRQTPDGYWVIDGALCNGCQDCIAACPFNALFWNPLAGQVIKCELCQGDPQCVQACPTGALVIRIVPG
jgi:carbon-monoxide dehydrogenase iron sulfur subunit